MRPERNVQNGPEHIAVLRTKLREAHQRMSAGEGFIYLAECGAETVKIGFSLNPQQRMRTLSVHCRDHEKPVRLLATMPGSIAAERALHKAIEASIGRQHCYREFYPRSVLSHPLIPHDLRPDVFGPPPQRSEAA